MLRCKRCSFKATHELRLRFHINMYHANIKKIICGQCDYRSQNKWLLEAHLKVHENEPLRKNIHVAEMKPFSCGRCDYKASVKRRLLDHVLTVHEKREEYSCKQCNYYSVSNLQRHIRVVHNKIMDFYGHNL